MTLVGLWFAMAIASGAHGVQHPRPQSLKVGDGVARGTRLRPYDNAWLYSVRFPDGRVKMQGIWSDHVELTTVAGRRALKRVQGMTYVNALSSSGITLMDARTCAPISSEQHRPDGLLIKREFADAHVTTERVEKPGNQPQRTAIDLPSSVFDFYGGSYGFLLSCFPLRVGYAATFPAISEVEDVLTSVTFRVIKEVSVRAGRKGTVRAFVVTADTPGEYTQTFWLARTPPYIIRLEITYPGAPYIASFDMI